MRPAADEFAPFYLTYTALVPEADIVPALERQPQELRELAATIPASLETFAYAPGKWTVRQVVGHMIDVERVFGFRAFCFSRGEQAPLPSFEQDGYVAAAATAGQPLAALVEEFAVVRAGNLLALRPLDEAGWSRRGTASGYSVTVRALAYMLVGHARHHAAQLHERYLGAAAG